MRSEKLSQQLGEMDNDLLEKAWEIDNEQKLNAYTRKAQRRVFRPKIAALAASVALVLLVSAVSLPWLGKHMAGPGVPVDPEDPTWASRPGDPVVPGQPNDKPLQKPQIEDIKNVRINSVDKLNYYAAMQLLADASKLSAQSQNGIKAAPLLDLVGQADDIIGTPDVPEVTVPETTEGPPVQEPTKPVSPTNPNEEIYYYEVDPSVRFGINEVIFFQIELTDANGFLASKVGTGLVDVVITDNSLDAMITFRNGDRFFSCLQNGHSPSEWDFSTHKYIQDFGIVKNLSQENYGFYVSFDGDGQATEFRCRPTEKGGDRPDQNVRIASTTTVSETGGTFTIAELEANFNQEKGV